MQTYLLGWSAINSDPQPIVSIIVPVYNGEPYLSETLDSIRNQSFKNWETVVIDDGSKDGSVGVALGYVNRDPRIRVVQQENSGVANARNSGFAATNPQTEFVIFLDHDDF